MKARVYFGGRRWRPLAEISEQIAITVLLARAQDKCEDPKSHARYAMSRFGFSAASGFIIHSPPPNVSGEKEYQKLRSRHGRGPFLCCYGVLPRDGSRSVKDETNVPQRNVVIWGESHSSEV